MPPAAGQARPRRSLLYVPGANARALEKAARLEADGLILDLEDSVAPAAKDTARRQIGEALTRHDYGEREIIIRVNDPASEWFAADVEMARAARPHALLLPKVNGPGDIARLAAELEGAGIAIWAMMETPLAMLAARDIAAAAREHPLVALVMGSNDLGKETGASLDGGRAFFIPWLMTVIAAARAFGLAAIDGVFNDFHDAEGLRAECRQGRKMGFDGKTLIHPSQIAAANEAFSPTREEIARARAIVAAFDRPENADAGVIAMEGEMVERLHLEKARQLLEVARILNLA